MRIGTHLSRVYPYKLPQCLLPFGHFSEKKWRSVPFMKQACEVYLGRLCARSWDVPSTEMHPFSQRPCYNGQSLESYVSGAFLDLKRENTVRRHRSFPCSTIPISQWMLLLLGFLANSTDRSQDTREASLSTKTSLPHLPRKTCRCSISV